MDKPEDKVTFAYQSERDWILGVILAAGFVVFLPLLYWTIYHRDCLIGLKALGAMAITLALIRVFFPENYLIFDRGKEMVYLQKGFCFWKSVSPLCSFAKVKEVWISSEEITNKEAKSYTKFYSQVVIEDISIKSEKTINVDNSNTNRDGPFKELIEEALKVVDITGCSFKYCPGIPEEPEKLIRDYRKRQEGKGNEQKVSEVGDYYRLMKPVTGYQGQYEDENFWDRGKNLPHPAWWEGEGTILEKRHSFSYKEGIISIIASPMGETVIIGTHEGNIYIVSLETGRVKSKIESSGKLESLQIHSNGILLIGKEHVNSTVHVWDLEMGKKLHSLSAGGAFKGLYIYPDRERIKILKKHGELTWSLYTGHLMDEMEMELMHEDSYDFMASHPAGHIKMEGHLDILTINSKMERFEYTEEEREKYFYHQFKPLYYYDGCDFLARACASRVFLWDLKSGKKKTIAAHGGYVTSVSIHHPLVTTGGKNNTLKLWNLETEKCIGKWPAEGPVVASAISPTGFIIYGTDKGKVEILEIKYSPAIDHSSTFTG